jgi:hypothetical protein
LHQKRIDNPKAQRPKATRADVDLLLQAAWAQGAWIERGGNQHFKVYPSGKGRRMVPIPATPSDYRTVRNKRSQLRRNGIDPTKR